MEAAPHPALCAEIVSATAVTASALKSTLSPAASGDGPGGGRVPRGVSDLGLEPTGASFDFGDAAPAPGCDHE